MKKAISILAATILLLSMSMGVAAQDDGTEFTLDYEKNPDPAYIVEIPATITLAEGGSEVAIDLVEATNLGGLQVQVYLVSGQGAYGGTLSLRRDGVPGAAGSIYYDIATEHGNSMIGGNDLIGLAYPTVESRELALFSDVGSSSYTVTPKITDVNESGQYVGGVTYGISLI